jgi:hypothetical protein
MLTFKGIRFQEKRDLLREYYFQAKRRPVLIVAELEGSDLIL